MMLKKFLCGLTLFLTAMLYAESYSCFFAPGKWDKSDWFIIKSARWDHVGSWVQQSDHITNHVPPGLNEEERKRSHKSYAAMMLKKKFDIAKTVTITSEMSFDHRMAPLIVFAPDHAKSPAGVPEFREHWEIVLYDLGINVWHHTFKDGKPYHVKAAYLLAPFKKHTRYRLICRISDTRKGRMLEVECDGKRFGCHLASLTGKDIFAGIIGCEGINRFYDFNINNNK